MRRVLVSAVFVCLGSLVGCGGGGSPTNPSSLGSSGVAGNYSGTITFTFTSLGGSETCPATTTVTQNGSSVTIGAITPSGACASLGASPALGTFSMGSDGSLGTQTLSNVPDSSCNGTFNTTFTAGFSGSTLQFSFVYTAASGGCLTQPGNFTLSGTLTKQ